MTVPKRVTAIVYGDGCIEAFRNREDRHEESFEVTDEEAAELLLSIEPCPTRQPTSRRGRVMETPAEPGGALRPTRTNDRLGPTRQQAVSRYRWRL